jgi:hypothetical protein
MLKGTRVPVSALKKQSCFFNRNAPMRYRV